MWQILTEPQYDINRSEAIRKERFGVVPQQLRIERDVVVNRAGARTGDFDYLAVSAVLKVGSFEDDEHLAAVVAASIESLSSVEYGRVRSAVVIGDLSRELPDVAAAHGA